MNERLTIRNWHFEIFRWLPIGRCDIGHGSDKALRGAKRPGVMRAIKVKIGAERAEKWNSVENNAIKQKDSARPRPTPSNAGAGGFFSSQRRGSQEDARSSGLAEKDLTFCANRFT
jgi:hypothetical protein